MSNVATGPDSTIGDSVTTPRPVVLRLALRAAAIWLTARVALLTIPLTHHTPSDLVVFLIVIVVLVHVDVRYKRENLWYANLGISPLAVSVVALTVVLVAEAALSYAFATWLPDFRLMPEL